MVDVLDFLLDTTDRNKPFDPVIELFEGLQSGGLQYYHTQSPQIPLYLNVLTALELWRVICILDDRLSIDAVLVDQDCIAQLGLEVLVDDNVTGL